MGCCGQGVYDVSGIRLHRDNASKSLVIRVEICVGELARVRLLAFDPWVADVSA
jgi:hypothetical protein